MLLSEAESKTISCATSQVAYGPRAVVDLVHAGTHLVRNSGDPANSFFPSVLASGGMMGKANHRTPMIDGRKSDKPIVPRKQSNKTDLSVAEAVEGRGLTKRNTQ